MSQSKVVYDQYGNAIPVGNQNHQQFGHPQYAQPQYGHPPQYAAQQQYAYTQQQHGYGGDHSYSNIQQQPLNSAAQGDYVRQASHIQPLKPQQSGNGGCNDMPFAILFIINVVAMIAFMVLWGFPALNDKNSNSNYLDSSSTHHVLVFVGVLCIIAAGLSFIFVGLIIKFARPMITFSLWFSVAISILFALYGFLKGSFVVGIIGLIFAAISVCYAFAARRFIPFSAANLEVAVAAVKTHCSVHVVAFIMLIVQIAWVFIWAMGLLGVSNKLGSKNANVNANGRPLNATCVTNAQCGTDYCDSQKTCQYPPLQQSYYFVYFLFLISFYWGLSVFNNIGHVTVAGTVSHWWMNDNSRGATGKAFRRSWTSSFGSICFGSLIVAILRALRELANQAAQNGDGCACVASCILGCIESLIEYFNKWAFIYVGIYGYKFTKAGKSVIELFKQRGFEAIISNDLIDKVLTFIALAIGLICAGLGVAFYYLDKSYVNIDQAPVVLGIIGFFVGVGISLIPLAVVDSAVSTIFVCFAEDPAIFAQTHPELYQPLVAAWTDLYPDVMIANGYYA